MKYCKCENFVIEIHLVVPSKCSLQYRSFHYHHGFLLMYTLMGEFCISWVISAVSLGRILRNTIFYRKFFSGRLEIGVERKCIFLKKFKIGHYGFKTQVGKVKYSPPIDPSQLFPIHPFMQHNPSDPHQSHRPTYLHICMQYLPAFCMFGSEISQNKFKRKIWYFLSN